MTKRIFYLVVVAVVGVATIIVFELHSVETSAAEQTLSQDPNTAPDYRILTSPVESVVKVTYTDKKGRTGVNPGPYLEEEINKLAAQGYTVESIQSVTSVSGGGGGAGFTLSGSGTMVVLLKKIRR